MNTRILSSASMLMTLAALFASAAPAAKAEYIILRQAPSVVLPSTRMYLRPSQQFVRRSYISSPSEMRIISQPAVVLPSDSVETKTITQQLLISPTIAGMENFRARLDRISDQIALGESRGWLTTANANQLRAEYRALAMRADNLMASKGTPKSEGDQLELDINVLNQRVTDSMSHI
jgi:hypothetical protein